LALNLGSKVVYGYSHRRRGATGAAEKQSEGAGLW
jgi:hypothetical protein